MNGKKYSLFKVLRRIIPLQFKVAPLHVTVDWLMGIVHAFAFTATIVATQVLFDAVTNAETGQSGFWDCVRPLLILAAATLGQQALNGAHNFWNGVVIEKSAGKITTLLHRKLQRIDPARFEDTAFLDALNKAREGGSAIPYVCVIVFAIFRFYAVYFASVGAYLFSMSPMLLITLMLAFIPAMLSQIIRGKVFTQLEEQNAPLRRENEYYQKALCDREYFKETRILGAFKFFYRLFSETLMLLTRKTWQAERKTALLQLAMNLTSFAGLAIASCMLFTATMAGEITVGAFAAVFTALRQIFGFMEEIVVWYIGDMNRNIGKVANFVRMLDIPERTGTDGEPDFTKGVTAESVSFSYPGRDTPAVKNVSLAIAAGETIAIVGENGAGKSTLVRLLTGIYRPAEGRVMIGGLDSAKTSPPSVYKGSSGVFQKYQRYKMTLAENIIISDMEREINAAKIESSIRDAGAELDEVGLSSMLSPEFDGVDLSGGEWQRLVIARGLYRANGFIILDEPTAAIDPIEEARVYKKFQQLTEGKCALIVTHRLGSAKLAHRIVVMDKGEIVDIGTHDELLARPGKYAGMWAAQAQWYERQPGQ